MVVVEVRFGPLRRAQMHEDRPDAAPFDLPTNPGNILQRLAAKRASKMTKENQQNGRLIQQRKQGSPGFRAVPPEHRGHLRFFWIRLLRIQNRQRHLPLPAPPKAGGNSLATAFPFPSLHRPGWPSLNSILKDDAVMLRRRSIDSFGGGIR